MVKRRSLKLSIPPQNRKHPGFCDGTVAGLKAWSEALPVANPLATAKSLHDGLVDLNRCQATPADRFAMLEQLRPYVNAACTAVAQRSRDTPLLLDERARKVAALAQRTQYQLAVGYKIVVVTALREGVRLAPDAADDSPTRMIVVAIHRSLTELLHTLHRSMQFYTRPPSSLWPRLHSLYALAELRGVHDEPVRDDEQRLRQLTVPADVYERAILLATAQPNKLRQADLAALFLALEAWTTHVRILPLDQHDAPVVVVDLAGDGPPRAAAQQPDREGADLRTPDTRRLVQKFDEYLAGDPEQAHRELPMVDLEHRELVRHCARVWGAPTDRAYERTPATGSVEVCTSLHHVHYYAGGGRSLLRQMQSERIEDEVLEEDEDPYVDPFAGAEDVVGVRKGVKLEAPKRHISEEDETDDQHPLGSLELADVSPIGFGLLCEGEVPSNMQTGQLLGLRETDDPDWRITIVRWVANGREQSRIGVETLAQRAISGGVRSVSSRGRDLDFERALLLPGIDALDQPPSLVTAPGAFAEGQKIAFTQGGHETKLLVEERIGGAESYEQLRVRELVTARVEEQDTGIEFEVMSEEEERAAMEAFGLLGGSDAPDERA